MATTNELIDAAVEALQDAHRAQRYDADPCHEDFYAWGWGLSALAAELASIAVLLERQVAAYPQRWNLRDDFGMEPTTRIARCRAYLEDVATVIGSASRYARDFHNEMSHVAVENERTG